MTGLLLAVVVKIETEKDGAALSSSDDRIHQIATIATLDDGDLGDDFSDASDSLLGTDADRVSLEAHAFAQVCCVWPV